MREEQNAMINYYNREKKKSGVGERVRSLRVKVVIKKIISIYPSDCSSASIQEAGENAPGRRRKLLHLRGVKIGRVRFETFEFLRSNLAFA